MNIYGLVILGALLIGYALNILARVLNLRTLGDPLPAEFEGVYDARDYARMQE